MAARELLYRREPDPSTGTEETAFHEQVRDILGLSPFDRHEQIYAELRRLKRVDEAFKAELSAEASGR